MLKIDFKKSDEYRIVPLVSPLQIFKKIGLVGDSNPGIPASQTSRTRATKAANPR